MELLKLATEWAKSEAFSTRFFIFFAGLFLIASIGFWQLGKTDIARAYVVPTLVAGILLLAIGIGLTYTNISRINEFETAYNTNANEFFESEITRAEKTLKEYNTIVFKVIPVIIIVAALLIVFVQSPAWRAGSITAIAMMAVILLVDSTAYGRMEKYHKELKKFTEYKMK